MSKDFTAAQIAAIQGASVSIDGPVVEIQESIRLKTPKGDRTVVTGKKGNYEYVLVSGKPIDKLYYVSAYSLKQALAPKVSTDPIVNRRTTTRFNGVGYQRG